MCALEGLHDVLIVDANEEEESGVWLSATTYSLRSQEASMEMSRWLLPFTHEVDMRAVDYVVRLAECAVATLVPVSLVSAPPNKGARLEHIQESKDFLEAVRFKAERLQVPKEGGDRYAQSMYLSGRR